MKNKRVKSNSESNENKLSNERKANDRDGSKIIKINGCWEKVMMVVMGEIKYLMAGVWEMGERNCWKESVMRWSKMNWKLDKTKIKVGGIFEGILEWYFNFSFIDKERGVSKALNKGGCKEG